MPPYPYVRVDLRHRVLSVVLDDAEVAQTVEFDDSHLVDLDAEGRAVGVEVLTPEDLKIEAMAEQFQFSDQVPAILDQIRRVLAPQTTTAVSSGAPIVVEGSSSSTWSREADARSEGQFSPRQFTGQTN